MIPYIETAQELAAEAAVIIKANFLQNVTREWKEDATPVTSTDKEINTLVLKRLRERYPDQDILAEEESDMGRQSEYVWVCDPIDGTIPFSHGIPTCVFSLALVRDGVPVLGVLVDPFLNRTVVAERGSGAFLNGEKTMIDQSPILSNGLVLLSGTTNPALNYPQTHMAIRAHACRTINLHSSQYLGLILASGQLTGFIDGSKHPHDNAALTCIIREAGGVVTNLLGEEQRYDRPTNGTIMANPALHPTLVELVANARRV